MIGTGVFTTRTSCSIDPTFDTLLTPSHSWFHPQGSRFSRFELHLLGDWLCVCWWYVKIDNLYLILLISMIASLAVYLEYASYFPHRSGAEVAYLEKAKGTTEHPAPKLLMVYISRPTPIRDSSCRPRLPSSPFCYLLAVATLSVCI